MFKPTLMVSGIALMLGTTLPVHAADDATTAEIEALKARVQALENSPAPAPAAAPASGNSFNPKISLILNGLYAGYSAPADAGVPGFLLGEETERTSEGLSLGETELAIEANVDDRFHGWTAISFADGQAEVEEAYINTLSLPAGLAVKFGRFFSDIGYQNHQHAHAWEFADAPLVYRAMLANQLKDDGVQLRWIAPTDLLLEVGAEIYRGAAFPGGGDERSGANGYTGFIHLGGDAGDSGSWRVGLSHLNTDADQRSTGEAPDDALFTGDSQLNIVDAVYKWAPNGNASVTNLVLQAEYFWRKEDGEVLADPTGAPVTSSYDGKQRGFYVQGVYQFMPRWRAGLRYDQLSADNVLGTLPGTGGAIDMLADNSTDPKRASAMVDFSNSEFSRFRLQYNRDQSRPNGETDHQVLVQYIFSLGSHPAHQF